MILNAKVLNSLTELPFACILVCLFYVATYAVFGGIKFKFHASVNCAFMLKVY